MEKIVFEHNGHSHEIIIDDNTPVGKDIAKLNYFFKHNSSHYEELVQLADSFTADGKPEIGGIIKKAAGLMKESNEYLEDALHDLS